MDQIVNLQEPIFIVLIDVWPHINWEMVTSNLTAVIKVTLMDVTLSKALLYRYSWKTISRRAQPS